MANGNCAFESIIDSISTRTCFGETFEGTPDYWRNVWMTTIENIAFDEWHGNLSLEEWKAEFEVLKRSGMYEVQLGDLVVPGIAHCTRKNIIIFNTSAQAHSPIYVVPASVFGGSANTDIPVCLAYNQVHYESLVPSSDEDIVKTTNLVKQFVNGEYHKTMADIPMFSNKTLQNYEEEFPSLDSETREIPLKPKVSTNKTNEDCLMTLDQLKKIPVKNRTPEQTRIYNRLMKEKRKQFLYGKYEVEFPSLDSQSKKVPLTTNNNSAEKTNEDCSMTLDQLKTIPVKNRTPQQIRLFSRLMSQKRKHSKSDEQLEIERKKNRECLQKSRMAQTEAEAEK